ncbi:MAG: vWA domain-containing protein, partial [Candidatus Promineifilaceae bacterium]|jgi:hypothetical protein
MDDRIVEFVRGLRSAGVRVSLAESLDAMAAVQVIGAADKYPFREALRTTLIKDSADFGLFNELFDIYFSSGGPSLQNAYEDLTASEREMLKAALAEMSGRLQQLLEWLTSSDGPSRQELEEMARRHGASWVNTPGEARWVSRRMLRQLGYKHLEEQIDLLVAKLHQMRMSPEAIRHILGVVKSNKEALAEQISRQVGLQAARERSERARELHGSDLLHRPFHSLNDDEAEQLRQEVGRLAAQLRSRSSLRRKRGKTGKFDPKGTIRANLRYGGVPFEIKHKRPKLKPQLVLICDVSTSMRPVAEFMLRLIYELQDQVAKARSFVFNADMEEISVTLAGKKAAEAVLEVLYDMPPGYYATDLGNSLETFRSSWSESVSHSSTVIILGDGRNNYNSPRIDLMKWIQKRAKRLIWLNPEHRQRWGTGDSDMLEYEPICDDVFQVRNLAQLSLAVDHLLANG